MSLVTLFPLRTSPYPYPGHQRSPSDTLSAKPGGFTVWPPGMNRTPRIQTTFRPRERELPRDPSRWDDRDLLSHVRTTDSLSEAVALSRLIQDHRLTPQALWYLQTDHEHLAVLARDETVQNELLLLAQSIIPSVSPTTPRIRHVRRLSEDLARPPPPPPPPPPPLPEEPELEEDDDVAESIVSEWALDDDFDGELESVYADAEVAPGEPDAALVAEGGGLGLDTGEPDNTEAAAPPPQPAPAETTDLIDLETDPEPPHDGALEASPQEDQGQAEDAAVESPASPAAGNTSSGHVPSPTEEAPSGTSPSVDPPAAADEHHPDDLAVDPFVGSNPFTSPTVDDLENPWADPDGTNSSITEAVTPERESTPPPAEDHQDEHVEEQVSEQDGRPSPPAEVASEPEPKPTMETTTAEQHRQHHGEQAPQGPADVSDEVKNDETGSHADLDEPKPQAEESEPHSDEEKTSISVSTEEQSDATPPAAMEEFPETVHGTDNPDLSVPTEVPPQSPKEEHEAELDLGHQSGEEQVSKQQDVVDSVNGATQPMVPSESSSPIQSHPESNVEDSSQPASDNSEVAGQRGHDEQSVDTTSENMRSDKATPESTEPGPAKESVTTHVPSGDDTSKPESCSQGENDHDAGGQGNSGAESATESAHPTRNPEPQTESPLTLSARTEGVEATPQSLDVQTPDVPAAPSDPAGTRSASTVPSTEPCLSAPDPPPSPSLRLVPGADVQPVSTDIEHDREQQEVHTASSATGSQSANYPSGSPSPSPSSRQTSPIILQDSQPLNRNRMASSSSSGSETVPADKQARSSLNTRLQSMSLSGSLPNVTASSRGAQHALGPIPLSARPASAASTTSAGWKSILNSAANYVLGSPSNTSSRAASQERESPPLRPPVTPPQPVPSPMRNVSWGKQKDWSALSSPVRQMQQAQSPVVTSQPSVSPGGGKPDSSLSPPLPPQKPVLVSTTPEEVEQEPSDALSIRGLAESGSSNPVNGDKPSNAKTTHESVTQQDVAGNGGDFEIVDLRMGEVAQTEERPAENSQTVGSEAEKPNKVLGSGLADGSAQDHEKGGDGGGEDGIDGGDGSDEEGTQVQTDWVEVGATSDDQQASPQEGQSGAEDSGDGQENTRKRTKDRKQPFLRIHAICGSGGEHSSPTTPTPTPTTINTFGNNDESDNTPPTIPGKSAKDRRKERKKEQKKAKRSGR